jgi:type II secretory pathway pseudopilin PulG
MIVITIIGFLAILAIPSIQHARQRAQETAFVNDLRLLAGDVIEYRGFEAGGLPPDAPPGVAPEGIASSLPKRFDWARPTAIGGYWDWERAAAVGEKVDGICYAGIAVFQPRRTAENMRGIDERIDDGDLSTGMFRQMTDGYIRVIEF